MGPAGIRQLRRGRDPDGEARAIGLRLDSRQDVPGRPGPQHVSAAPGDHGHRLGDVPAICDRERPVPTEPLDTNTQLGEEGSVSVVDCGPRVGLGHAGLGYVFAIGRSDDEPRTRGVERVSPQNLPRGELNDPVLGGGGRVSKTLEYNRPVLANAAREHLGYDLLVDPSDLGHVSWRLPGYDDLQNRRDSVGSG